MQVGPRPWAFPVESTAMPSGPFTILINDRLGKTSLQPTQVLRGICLVRRLDFLTI